MSKLQQFLFLSSKSRNRRALNRILILVLQKKVIGILMRRLLFLLFFLVLEFINEDVGKKTLVF